MGLITRFTRLCKADIHGVMDQLEDKHLVLKQCLREMEEALEQKQVRLEKIKGSIELNRREEGQLKSEEEKLEEDLVSAINKERDDIARMVIRKLKTVEHHLKVIGLNGNTLGREIALLTESLEVQKHQYSELQLRSDTYFHQTHQADTGKNTAFAWPRSGFTTVSDEEIELELIKRKEQMKGGL